MTQHVRNVYTHGYTPLSNDVQYRAAKSYANLNFASYSLCDSEEYMIRMECQTKLEGGNG